MPCECPAYMAHLSKVAPSSNIPFPTKRRLEAAIWWGFPRPLVSDHSLVRLLPPTYLPLPGVSQIREIRVIREPKKHPSASPPKAAMYGGSTCGCAERVTAACGCKKKLRAGVARSLWGGVGVISC